MVVMSTCAGLWRYVLGDVVEFESVPRAGMRGPGRGPASGRLRDPEGLSPQVFGSVFEGLRGSGRIRWTPRLNFSWRVKQAGERLANARLAPAMLTSRLERATERLEAGVTMLRSLDPDAPLKRGYAMVFDGQDGLVRSAEGARAAGALSLKFADGRVAASTGDAPPPASSPPSRPRKSARKSPPPSPKQDDLFG